jgi:hypothetical protein
MPPYWNMLLGSHIKPPIRIGGVTSMPAGPATIHLIDLPGFFCSETFDIGHESLELFEGLEHHPRAEC